MTVAGTMRRSVSWFCCSLRISSGVRQAGWRSSRRWSRRHARIAESGGGAIAGRATLPNRRTVIFGAVAVGTAHSRLEHTHISRGKPSDRWRGASFSDCAANGISGENGHHEQADHDAVLLAKGQILLNMTWSL